LIEFNWTAMETFASGLSSNLEPEVRRHLKNVYATVTLSAASAAVGSFVHLNSTLMSAGMVSMVGALLMLVWLMMTPHDGKNQGKRLCLLSGFAFCSGINMGPLLAIAMSVNPTIVMEALMSTAALFCGFTFAALYAPRGDFLYLGGSLMAMLSTLFWLSLLNLFVGSTLLFQANFYLGLVLMCGFIVYDTQLIMEKRRAGNKDYISHGLTLFLDALHVFKKLVIILTDKNANQKRKRKD